MNISRIYRKRIIPKDLIPLDDDIIVAQDEETLITKWKTLNPKTAFSHGCSCFFLKEGIKVSKVYRSDGSVLRWYCDIVDFSFGPEEGSMTYTDLLADVIIDSQGLVKVVGRYTICSLRPFSVTGETRISGPKRNASSTSQALPSSGNS